MAANMILPLRPLFTSCFQPIICPESQKTQQHANRIHVKQQRTSLIMAMK